MKRQIIEHSLREANDALADFLASPRTLPTMEAIVDTMAEALRNGCKIMSCGNGGSLCDATHFAEELTGRFRENRRPLAAMAINDPAYMTCVGNDFSFGDIFVRWVEAFGKPGDVLLAISTSGNSQNIVAAAEAARRLGTAPAETVVFEDALHAARTAHEAGFRVCGVWDASAEEDQAALKALADWYVRDLGDWVP